jgi:hypothetical protein
MCSMIQARSRDRQASCAETIRPIRYGRSTVGEICAAGRKASMSDGKTHKKIAMASGGVAALLTTNEKEPWKLVAEMLGGVLGGLVGGKLPDIIEPAVHSWHRNVAHSFTTAAAVVSTAANGVQSWHASCRAKADAWAQRRRDPKLTPADRALALLAELVWRIAAGIPIGAAAGYVSHLVLDAGTPRGIPLLARGF